MCLYDSLEDTAAGDDEDEDHSFARHGLQFMSHPSLRQSYKSNYHRRRPPSPLPPRPTIDPEVLNEMRQAGLTESQIQEQIDFHFAERFALILFSSSTHPLLGRPLPAVSIRRSPPPVSSAIIAIVALHRIMLNPSPNSWKSMSLSVLTLVISLPLVSLLQSQISRLISRQVVASLPMVWALVLYPELELLVLVSIMTLLLLWLTTDKK
jgi:hypothetical protein